MLNQREQTYIINSLVLANLSCGRPELTNYLLRGSICHQVNEQRDVRLVNELWKDIIYGTQY